MSMPQPFGHEEKPTTVAFPFGIVGEGYGWRVTEIVTPRGHWITLPSFYSTKEAATKAAIRMKEQHS